MDVSDVSGLMEAAWEYHRVSLHIHLKPEMVSCGLDCLSFVMGANCTPLLQI